MVDKMKVIETLRASRELMLVDDAMADDDVLREVAELLTAISKMASLMATFSCDGWNPPRWVYAVHEDYLRHCEAGVLELIDPVDWRHSARWKTNCKQGGD